MNADRSPTADPVDRPQARARSATARRPAHAPAASPERALRDCRARLAAATQAARIGTWLHDTASGRHEPDAAALALLGLPADRAVRTVEAVLPAVHPDDRARLAAALRAALEGGGPLDVEYRVLAHDGSVRRLRDRAAPVLDGTRPTGLVAGACVEVTGHEPGEPAAGRDDRAKAELLAMLSHELRNPLAPIRYALAAIERAHDEPASVHAALGILARQVGLLGRLVDDLIEGSRIEHGRIRLRIAPVTLAEAIDAAAETVMPMIARRAQRLEVHAPPHGLRISADAGRLVQVLANLLHNASKFTPPGGHVELRAEQVGDEVSIRVRDDGCGIDARVLPHVFELFEQGGAPGLDRATGGLGIGLALVRRLVALHGGRVRAHSDGPGRGATFTVTLPVDGPR